MSEAPNTPNSQSESRSATPALDFLPLRARLGRMLGRSSPITEAELHAANLALVAAIKARDNAPSFTLPPSNLPAALVPLLLTHLASAWAQGDQSLAAALETLHRRLTQPEPADIVAIR